MCDSGHQDRIGRGTHVMYGIMVKLFLAFLAPPNTSCDILQVLRVGCTKRRSACGS